MLRSSETGAGSDVFSAGDKAAGGLPEVKGHLSPCPGESPSNHYGATWICTNKITGANLSGLVSVEWDREGELYPMGAPEAAPTPSWARFTHPVSSHCPPLATCQPHFPCLSPSQNASALLSAGLIPLCTMGPLHPVGEACMGPFEPFHWHLRLSGHQKLSCGTFVRQSS